MRIEELILLPEAGETVWLRGLGARYLVTGEQTGGRFAVVVHPIKTRALAAPLHTHAREDEISLVIAGRIGVQIGDRVMVAEQGTVVFKPRGIPHAFWNAGDEEARVLEMITPAGFEEYFREMAAVFADAPTGAPDMERAAAICAKYELAMDYASIPQLIEAHHLRG